MTLTSARALSILGHPLPVLASTLLVLAARGGGAVPALLRMALGCAAIAALVVAYSRWRVRRGDWRHIDASGVGERWHLNLFLLAVLLASSALAAVAAQPELASLLALSALIVAIALATARWWMLSLHLAFAAFSAVLLLRIGWQASAAMIAFATLLASSRLRLARHVAADLVAGACAGALAGFAAWLLPLPWQA